jgi:hypothetical protein
MLTEFIYAYCFYICSLCLYVVTIFIYAHCLYICSLFLYILTIFIYAHCLYICSLFYISLHSSKYHCVLVNIPFMLLLHAAVHY